MNPDRDALMRATQESATEIETDGVAVEAVEVGPLWVRLSGEEIGLKAIEVSVPVPVALSLIDLLLRFGVVLSDFGATSQEGWVIQRYAVVEADGALVRGNRRLRLQSEILELLERSRP